MRFFDHTHLDTLPSVGLLWTSDKLVAETTHLTTHNTHNRQTSIPLVGFEPAIAANELPQTHALDRAATGIGVSVNIAHDFFCLWSIKQVAVCALH